MEAILEFFEVLVGVFMVGIQLVTFVGILWLIGIAARSVLQNRSVNWQLIVFVAIVLFSANYMVRIYPVMIMGSILESFRETMPVADQLREEATEWVMSGINQQPSVGTRIDTSSPSVVIDEPVVVNPQVIVPSPTPTPHVVSSYEGWTGRHTVQPGESLQSIADMYNTQLSYMMYNNNDQLENPAAIRAGMVLVVPGE